MSDRNLPTLNTPEKRLRYRNKYELAAQGVRVCEGKCRKLKALTSDHFYRTSGGTFDYVCAICRCANKRRVYLAAGMPNAGDRMRR